MSHFADDTVKLHIKIRIDSDNGEADTGLTVAAWNAMTDDERTALTKQMWMDDAANGDDGGIWVLTPGAEEI